MNQTLSVSLRPSRIFALALTVTAGTALVCVWISLTLPAFLLAAVGIVLTWAWYLAQALQLGRFALRALELNVQGSARCQDGTGRWHEFEILPGSYVSGWLIVVILGEGGRRRRSLVFLPDGAAADDLRRLRAWLRWRLARS